MDFPLARPTAKQPINWKAVGVYLLIALFLMAAVLVWSALNKPLLVLAALAASISLAVICSPRLALYQFVFFFFLNPGPLTAAAIPIVELSGGLVILAALLDIYLHRPDLSVQVPPLTLNYLAILAAVILAGVLSYYPPAAWRMIMRVCFLMALFLSVSRLSRRFSLKHLLNLYLAICVTHAVIVLAQFIAGGGEVRAFGLSHIIFDELSMLALPIALAFYLTAPGGKAWKYLAGAVLVFGGLVATQSRAPIMFGLLGAALTLWLGRSPSSSSAVSDPSCIQSRKRAFRLVGYSLILILGLVVLKTDLWSAVAERFERLATSHPGGTFAMRITLWKTALMAFRDHPLLGLGPGMFKQASEFYSSLHFDPTYYWVRGLSAHNMTLHYLAETGLIGTLAMLSLFFRQYVLARRFWRSDKLSNMTGEKLALVVIAILLLLTTLLEAGWMWGYTGSIAVFFLALISSTQRLSSDEPGKTVAHRS